MFYEDDDNIIPIHEIEENTKTPEKEDYWRNPYYLDAIKHNHAFRHVVNEDGIKEKHLFYGIDDSEKLAEYIDKMNTGRELHEILFNSGEDKWQKLFFDIDAKEEIVDECNTTFARIVDVIEVSINSVLRDFKINSRNIKITRMCGNRPGKYSARLFYDVYVLAGHAKCIPYKVKLHLGAILREFKLDPVISGFIDMGVYNTNHSIRMHLSPKGNTAPPLMIIRKPHTFDNINMAQILSRESYNQTLDIDTVVTHSTFAFDYVKCDHSNKTKKTCQIDRGNNVRSIKIGKDKVSELAGKFIKDHPQYDVRNINGSLVNLYDSRMKPCLICDRTHESENPFLFMNDSGMYFKCRRENKYKLIISLGTRSKNKASIEQIVKAIITSISHLNIEFKTIHKKTCTKYITGFLMHLLVNPRSGIIGPMGSGKSYELENYVMELDSVREQEGKPYAIMVSIVHRVSLRDSMLDRYKRMGFKSYHEIGGNIILSRCKRILIQVESLYRLDVNCDVDLLILDEYNAITQQFLSKLGPDHMRSLRIWQWLCKASASTLMLDANLSPITVRAMEILTGQSIPIWINEPPKEKNIIANICENEVAWEDLLLRLLKSGKKIDVVTARGEDFCDRLQATIEESLKIKVLTIHGKKDNTEALDNPNTKWVQFDCLIRSQSVNAGVDFNVPHFDCVFVDIGSYGSNSDDIMQSIFRSRNITDNTYYLLFKRCIRYERPITEEGVIEYETNKINHNIPSNLSIFSPEKTKNGFMFNDVNDDLFRAYANYIAYHNLKTNDLMGDVIRGFHSLGAKFEFAYADKMTSNETEKRIKASYEKIRIASNNKIANARDIMEYEYIIMKRYKKNTETELAEIDKYNLRATYSYHGEINEDWVNKYRKPENIKMARNIYLRYFDTETILRMNKDEVDKFKSDVEKFNIRLTGALRKSLDEIKAIHEKYNKTEFYVTKMMEYINNQIDAGNPVFGDTKKKLGAEACTLHRLNKTVLYQLGYKITKCERIQITKEMKKIYNYDIVDLSEDIFTPVEYDDYIDNKPSLKRHIPWQEKI